MSEKNFYQVLGIKPDSKIEEIRIKYRKLAFKYHPDRNLHLSQIKKDQHEEQFKLISQAYYCLSNPSLRTKYDLKMKIKKVNHYYSSPGDNSFTISDEILKSMKQFFTSNSKQDAQDFVKTFSDFVNLGSENYQHINDIIQKYRRFYYNRIVKTPYKSPTQENKLVRKTRKRYQTAPSSHIPEGKAEDVIFNVNVNLSDIYIGKSKPLTVKRKVLCGYCGGQGYVGNSTFDMKLCSNCRGIMFHYHDKVLDIDIRQKKIVFSGEGHQEPNRETGDVIVNVYSKLNDKFAIHNSYDLVTHVPITLGQIYNGVEINFMHIDGSMYHIKYHDDQTNEKKLKDCLMIRIRDLGLPIESTGRRGDLYIKFDIALPNLNQDLIDQLVQLDYDRREVPQGIPIKAYLPF